MNDMETFKELMHGMAEATSPAELWIKQARFMRWCGDNPDKLANLIVAPAEPASLGAEAAAEMAAEIWRRVFGGAGSKHIKQEDIEHIIRKHQPIKAGANAAPVDTGEEEKL